MGDQSQTIQDIILACNSDGVVKSILYQNAKFCNLFEEGEYFFKNVQVESLAKALSFFSEVKKIKRITNYEINFVCNQTVETLIFSGAYDGQELIILASSRLGGFPLYDEMMEINNEQVNLFRQELKKNSHKQQSGDNNEYKFYDEISRLNNELTNVQRELSKKNIQLNQLNLKLEELTIRDPLTNLYNKRYLYTKYAEEITRARRFQYAISLVMIDINNFKQVNDRLGHQEGDRLLKKFAELCQANIRAGLDYPFRVGGDEFVLLLTHCEEATAESILERLDREFSKYTEIASLAHGVVSFIGGSGDEVEMVLKEADVKMYAHKHKIKALQTKN
ncbi:MAG: GGDEF domain-containing protein [Acetobacterium sp.]|nr:GGDEF domain-containing protein [Acetobacterium sp.]